MSKECTHVCERWFAYEWAFLALPPRAPIHPRGSRLIGERAMVMWNMITHEQIIRVITIALAGQHRVEGSGGSGLTCETLCVYVSVVLWLVWCWLTGWRERWCLCHVRVMRGTFPAKVRGWNVCISTWDFVYLFAVNWLPRLVNIFWWPPTIFISDLSVIIRDMNLVGMWTLFVLVLVGKQREDIFNLSSCWYV